MITWLEIIKPSLFQLKQGLKTTYSRPKLKFKQKIKEAKNVTKHICYCWAYLLYAINEASTFLLTEKKLQEIQNTESIWGMEYAMCSMKIK